MYVKLVLLLSTFSQILAQTSFGSSQKASSTSTQTTVTTTTTTTTSRTGTSSTSNSILLPIKDLQSTQSRLVQTLQQQTAALSQLQASFNQKATNWYFQSPGLRTSFEDLIGSVSGQIDQANAYVQGSARLLQAMGGGSGVDPEWIDRVRKVQGLGEIAMTRGAEGIAAMSRTISQLSQEQQVYNDAKAQQMIETKAQMDATLESLLQQTLQVGVQASTVLKNAMSNWSTILQTQLGAAAAPAIARLQEITAQTLNDMARLRPEDIEAAMTDAHRSIEDVKGLFYSSGVPSALVRQAVNPVQLGVFATLTKARAIHL